MEISRQKTVESVEKTVSTVNLTTDFPPKTLKSVAKTRVIVAEASNFTPRKLARRLVFTEFGLSPLVTTSPPLPLPVPLPEDLHSQAEPPHSPFCAMKLESPKLPSQASTRVSKYASKSRKKCHCKRSKCLMLYCECFASGAYCDGCSCSYCHNDIENEALRRTAVENILERNPNAFRPKIASSPCSTQAVGDKAKNVPIMGKHNKGCKCKKTSCIKKYCECFQANIACSENCKCVDCKNLDGCEQSMAHSWGGCDNSKASIEQTNAATFAAIGSSGCIFSQETRKKKFRKILDSDEKEIQSLTKDQQVNPVRVSGSFPTFSVDPACYIVSSTVFGSSKFAYRSLFTDVIQPPDKRELCSFFVVASEAAKILTAKENKAATFPAAQDGKNQKKEPGVQKVVPDNNLSTGNQTDTLNTEVSGNDRANVQEGSPFSPQRDELMCNEEEKSFMGAASPEQNLNHGFTAELYGEKERLALTCLRDCLAKLITSGTVKAAELSKPLLKSDQN